MKGWKTWVGGIGAIATGLGVILSGIHFEPNFMVDMNKVQEGLAVMSGGFAIIGIGHKIEKSLK